MENLCNIARSLMRRDEYIGYGGGMIWRISRYNNPGTELAWRCASNKGPHDVIFAGTLQGISEKLRRLYD